MQSPDNSILDEIRASGRLPSPTGVALTILELTRDPNVDLDDMAQVLQGDPSLTGNIIKYANSAAAGSREPVASINDALVRLGMRLVRQLCLGFSLLSNSRTGQCEAFDYTGFWAHSLAMASSCQTLAHTMGTVTPDEGFTCGLLAEIGGLALASVYPEAYDKVLAAWDGGAREHLLQLEHRHLSITRNQVTAALFEDWGLPAYYPQAVLHKDETGWADLDRTPPVTEAYAKLANLLFAGNLAAEICTTSGRERHWRVLDLMNFARLFRLDEKEWADIYNEILEEWARMGKVLDVITGQLPTMMDMLRSARSVTGTSAGDIPDGVIDDRHRPKTMPLANTDVGPTGPNGLADETHLPLRILLATDCPLHKAILTKRLSAAGHHVTCAQNGRKALEMALAEPPQLIISDWMLREMDGLELCRTLRSSPQLSHIHFIIMTSHDSNEELVEAFEAGINYYLVKPLNQHILTALLRGAAREVTNREEVQRQKEELRYTNAQVSIANRNLKTMALEDQLTELPNRRAGLAGMEQAWSKSSRNHTPLLVMILDIDHFKNVNDTYGHDAGDVVLQSTAAAMKEAIRDYDQICRFGGEEFLVVCPDAGMDVAAEVGNRIRKSVEENILDTPEFKGNVTISIGVAIREPSVANSKDLIKLADDALYAAKEAGRNKVCIYSAEHAHT